MLKYAGPLIHAFIQHSSKTIMYTGCPDAIHTASLAGSLKRCASSSPTCLSHPHPSLLSRATPFQSTVSSVIWPLFLMVDPKYIIVHYSECNASPTSTLYRSLSYPLSTICEFRHHRGLLLFLCPTAEPSIIHPSSFPTSSSVTSASA
jgi:hypothetical protein